MPVILDSILRPWRIRKLKRRYIELHGLSSNMAETALERQLTVLKMKRPGKSEEWYLEKIIYDLHKDRSR
ncbi:MAG: hypothetical protein ACM3PE_03140 [Deltaproteobacteria bacterium]